MKLLLTSSTTQSFLKFPFHFAFLWRCGWCIAMSHSQVGSQGSKVEKTGKVMHHVALFSRSRCSLVGQSWFIELVSRRFVQIILGGEILLIFFFQKIQFWKSKDIPSFRSCQESGRTGTFRNH